MNRALRAATMGVLLLSPVALGACSAGQVTQTATQDRDKTGAMATVGELQLRDVQLAYPLTGVYQAGGDARLLMAIANPTGTDDRLISITGEQFEGVEVVPDPALAAAAPAAAPTDPSTVDIAVPANQNVYVGEGPQVTLTGLTEELTPAQTVDVVLTFENAGEITVPALVGVSSRALPRGEAFDFHEEEGAGGGDTEGSQAYEEDTEADGGRGSESGDN
ncbi:copper chaperone PCu(A)C [Modestobacter sp. I12A-02628]|uniref:Copper chaperone PCu(A)C n=1 Tax=Goekera deserti TaxID=2497753 RepID=A0A7K3WJ87_9ACTN|nr:copper chaperone PCu(A)C [Goekera deserti]MPQ98186.1 copper chaperone PCu(A)C [Goekera deserti]NDI48836.1 copper chaperone PCu(A)C [Goekera deserti]NEL56517.1 copper chaperone PCu(A)C [Goekera deserti]